MLRKGQHKVIFRDGNYWDYICTEAGDKVYSLRPVMSYASESEARSAVDAANDVFMTNLNARWAEIEREKKAQAAANSAKNKKKKYEDLPEEEDTNAADFTEEDNPFEEFDEAGDDC